MAAINIQKVMLILPSKYWISAMCINTMIKNPIINDLSNKRIFNDLISNAVCNDLSRRNKIGINVNRAAGTP